ncbi:MAG: Gfo/Idh/MocA family oxidoreductase [Actinobacteria bacterium]|nr:Gfo/Idh/MocA family oxidoreductase [Cyanobacteriota bacterium]MCL5770812.1 Gfo/Idh/MocA family oxidoreductase [Actinomycetota bacterium]
MAEGGKVGFVAMTSEEKAKANIPEVGIGMIGQAFMGKAHSNAWKQMPYIFWPPAAIPKLVTICGVHEEALKESAKRYGYEKYTTNWKDVINDEKIQIVDIGTPNYLHAEISIEAAKAGKNIICEKPLARNSKEAKEMRDFIKKAGVKNICCFNYRTVPAIVLIKNLIMDGKLGRIYHFRARYLQEWIMDPNFPMIWKLKKSESGSGALGDLGSHIIDLGRFLCGEIKAVMATSVTFIKERYNEQTKSKEKVEVDDAIASVLEFENGAIGTIEASRFCAGRKNYNTIEINAENGSIWWDLENMNNLWVFWRNESLIETQGFHCVNVTESYHPYYDRWWPHGHIIGWENTFVHIVYNMTEAVINNKPVEPYIATFEDGYRNAVVSDAIIKSSETGKKEFCVFE